MVAEAMRPARRKNSRRRTEWQGHRICGWIEASPWRVTPAYQLNLTARKNRYGRPPRRGPLRRGSRRGLPGRKSRSPAMAPKGTGCLILRHTYRPRDQARPLITPSQHWLHIPPYPEH
jgi:hypothetical protein